MEYKEGENVPIDIVVQIHATFRDVHPSKVDALSQDLVDLTIKHDIQSASLDQSGYEPKLE